MTGTQRLARNAAANVSLATQAFGFVENPPVILVMGATASMLGWPKTFCETLAEQGLFVIRYDHRDTGQSTSFPPGPPAYGVEDMVEDLFCVLDAYGLNEAHIVGMSLGGLICQIAALQHPARVKTVTLIASEPLGWYGAPLPGVSQPVLSHFGTLPGVDWSSDQSIFDFMYQLDRLITLQADTSVVDAAAARRIDEQIAHARDIRSAYNHTMLSLKQDWTGQLGKLSQRVLIIHGDRDPVLPPENAHALKSILPQAELMIMPDTAHEIPARLHGHIAQSIRSFIEGAGPPSRASSA